MHIDKAIRHQEICNYLNDMYAMKNKAYGDSFGKRFKKHGVISAFIRIEDKFERLESLINGANDNGESILDTIYDLANYAIMFAMELEFKGDYKDA